MRESSVLVAATRWANEPVPAPRVKVKKPIGWIVASMVLAIVIVAQAWWSTEPTRLTPAARRVRKEPPHPCDCPLDDPLCCR
jgi:hypothetical protein